MAVTGIIGQIDPLRRTKIDHTNGWEYTRSSQAEATQSKRVA
jgi:hypothetical protein